MHLCAYLCLGLADIRLLLAGHTKETTGEKITEWASILRVYGFCNRTCNRSAALSV